MTRERGERSRYRERNVRPLLRAALIVGLIACGESKPSMPDVNIAACGSIGMACGTDCPNDLECITNACAPVRGACGGFAGAECQDTSLICAYPRGSSAGVCMRTDEK